jgi:hypothetical protein
MKTLVLAILVSCVTLTSKAQADGAQVPDTVKVGAYIISLHDINFHEKEYTIRFWLWFVYDNPDFDFSKQLDIPNAKSIEPPEIIMDSIDNKGMGHHEDEMYHERTMGCKGFSIRPSASQGAD